MFQRSPAYLHYKVLDTSPDMYIERTYPSKHGGTFSYWEHKDHFRGQGANPVGLQHNVSDERGFFMEQFEVSQLDSQWTIKMCHVTSVCVCGHHLYKTADATSVCVCVVIVCIKLVTSLACVCVVIVCIICLCL